jgi:hypothetical protein
MLFGKAQDIQSASANEPAPEIEKIVCVLAICGLASLPLVLSVAVTIIGA